MKPRTTTRICYTRHDTNSAQKEKMNNHIYHVFGDTGGQYTPLYNGLLKIGLHPKTLKLPKNTTIIHVGDLIHKGPDSLKVLQLVDSVMEVNPENWIQLLGNHEMNYIEGSIFFWRDLIPVEGQIILQKWLRESRVQLAVALNDAYIPAYMSNLDESKSLLITHAGLTRRYWVNDLDKSNTVNKIANKLNYSPISKISQGGEIIYGPSADGKPYDPSPIWATSKELWSSWVNSHMPFNQIHGHTNIWFPYQKKWVFSTKKMVNASTVDKETGFVKTLMGRPEDKSISISIDPSYGALPWNDLQNSLLVYGEK